jgi:hypothetical protein
LVKLGASMLSRCHRFLLFKDNADYYASLVTTEYYFIKF